MFLIKIENSFHCTVEGIVARNAAFWNTVVYRSRDIRLRDLKIINKKLVPAEYGFDGVVFDNSTDSFLYIYGGRLYGGKKRRRAG